MVLVSASPGEDHGALGVVTLEDVIEELIGEEIVDETDVFVDVSRHVKRMSPATATSHHAFHRISSRIHLSEEGGRLRPLNKATEPKPTASTKISIKPGTDARVVSQEERILGKKAARENYGTMQDSSDPAASRSSGTLIEETIQTSSNGDTKVVIGPSRDSRDDDDDSRPLL